MKTCNRIRSGATCGRLTEYADAWCRRPDCPGHRTADRPPMPANPAPREGAPVPEQPAGPVPLDPDEAFEIRIARLAVGSFVAVHGGSPQAAEAELRSMLEDFLRDATAKRNDGGYWSLARDGYRCTLSPDCSTMVNYKTLHGERSWSQFKAGVPSRYPQAWKERRRAKLAERAGDGDV